MVHPPKKVTIGHKTVGCIFIGYALNSSAYRFVVHKSEIPTVTVGTAIESRNVVFLENTFSCKDKENVASNSETKIEDETTSSKSMVEEPESRKRMRHNPKDAVLRRGRLVVGS